MPAHTLLLITSAPHSHAATLALKRAQDLLTNGAALSVFFYGDGAYHANRLLWQTADVANLSDGWVALADRFDLALPVCVSTALARGITDGDNALRHGLDGENLRAPFRLVGLSELALLINDGVQVEQF